MSQQCFEPTHKRKKTKPKKKEKTRLTQKFTCLEMLKKSEIKRSTLNHSCCVVKRLNIKKNGRNIYDNKNIYSRTKNPSHDIQKYVKNQ